MFYPCQSTINALPGEIGFKTLSSEYIAVNRRLAISMGYNDETNIPGLNDFDIRSSFVALAEQFRYDDKSLSIGQEKKTLDINVSDGSVSCTLSNKTLLLDEHRIPYAIAFQRQSLMTSQCKLLVKHTHQTSHYIINEHFENSELTDREQQCLFLLMRGYSAIEIARVINISPKTVEYYIQQVKDRFGVSKRSQLIESAIARGFYFNVPISLLRP